MSIISFAPNRTTYCAENPGPLAASPSVVVAWILLEQRRHDGATNKRSPENVGVSRSEALRVPLRSLPVVMPAICGLVNTSQHPDSDKRDRIRGGFPGQLEFVFRRERSRIIAVGDIEIRDQAKHSLLFLFLDLLGRELIRR